MDIKVGVLDPSTGTGTLHKMALLKAGQINLSTVSLGGKEIWLEAGNEEKIHTYSTKVARKFNRSII